MTPDGKPLNYGMCVCSMHCKNRCEIGHCGEAAGWCECSCHAREYAALRSSEERDYGGAFDGNTVTSDADGGL